MHYEEALFGFGSSAIAITLTYPADTLARQNQVALGRNSISPIGQSLRGLYKGLCSALITQPTYWACYWPLYSFLTLRARESSFHERQPFATSVVVSYSAASIATVMTNPLWMIRQRMQTELIKQKDYSYVGLVREIYQENGWRTFLRGTGITLAKNIQTGLLLPVFQMIRRLDVWEETPPAVAAAVSGAVAKIMIATWLYPVDVLRTNVRFVEHKNVSVVAVARQLLTNPGHLYRGIGWYWLSSCGTFAIMMALNSLRAPTTIL